MIDFLIGTWKKMINVLLILGLIAGGSILFFVFGITFGSRWDFNTRAAFGGAISGVTGAFLLELFTAPSSIFSLPLKTGCA